MAALTPTPGESIASLLSLEQRIPSLLTLLSQALEGLLPPPEGEEELEEGERFLEAARGYYELLDDVQLELRTSIHHLKLGSALPLLADFTPKAGPSSTSGSSSGSGEAQVEREALEERKWALLELLGRGRQPLVKEVAEGRSAVGPPRADLPEEGAASPEVKVERPTAVEEEEVVLGS